MTGFNTILAEGRPLVGTFLKTPHPMIVETLEDSGLDFVILDAEHEPFDLAAIDVCLLAGRAIGIPCLVRVTEARPADVLRILDMGADGFLAPHVLTAGQAAAIVRSAHYGEGGRGYSAANRAGRMGKVPMGRHLRNAKGVSVVVQIEDPEAVGNVEAIAAVPGVSAMFVGRADLAVAYGDNDLSAPSVNAALRKVMAAGKTNNVPVATFAATMDDARAFFEMGVGIMAVASEHKPIQDYFGKAAVAAAKGG